MVIFEMILLLLFCMLLLIFGGANNMFLFFYFMTLNLITMGFLISCKQYFITIIMGLIFMTAYSFIILLLLMNYNFSNLKRNMYPYISIFMMVYGLIMYMNSLYKYNSYSIIFSNTYSQFTYLYYTMMPNIYHWKLYILLMALFLFTLMVIMELFNNN